MSSDEIPKYIYDIPYAKRKELHHILDMNKSWEELGGEHMNFDVGALERFDQAKYRGKSPTEELLTLWGTQNHTIVELFVLLSRMQHYRAMMVLKPLVDVKWHRLIYEGEENLSRILANTSLKAGKELHPSSGERSSKAVVIDKDLALGEHNIHRKDFGKETESKVLGNKYRVTTQEEAKVVNAVKGLDCNGHNNQASKESGNSDFVLDERFVITQSPTITYAELEAATNGWDKRNLLGKGGFGAVYRGIWKNTEVAVKRLEMQREGDYELMLKTQRELSLREFRCLNSCRHDNILPLFGCSIGGPHYCLVYQYMRNGSLEDWLLCRDQSKLLNWPQRHSIATGIAAGLQFLHTIHDKPLVHGDIKSANILLDRHLEPKIGDFGLARDGPLQPYTHVKVSKVHGTRPYLPNEFLRARKLSTKVDVYSFGIVLFELATGLRAYDELRQVQNHTNCKFLKDLIDSLSDDNISTVQDKKAGCDYTLLFPFLITLGRQCVSSRPKDRPEMVAVHKELKGFGSSSRSYSPHFISPVPTNNRVGSPSLAPSVKVNPNSNEQPTASAVAPAIKVLQATTSNLPDLPQSLNQMDDEASPVIPCLTLLMNLNYNHSNSVEEGIK